ncbi:hypothetical protein BD779DRAFT_134284 [Infundibulicybe gibba]|nr:hypothetical protein BD779DRAFT_134284 [Infundibulicybe gibba]
MTTPSEAMLITGPTFVGCILNWCLFGVLVVQMYDYYSISHKSDGRVVKALVYGAFTLEIVQTSLVTDTSWGVLVGGWGVTDAITHTTWSSGIIPIFNSSVAIIVQLFFARRIWVLKKHIVAHMIAGAVAFLCCGIAVTCQYFLVARKPSELSKLLLVGQLWLIGSLLCDILITGSMVTILVQNRRRTAFKSTESVINRLIINTIENGAIMSIIALLELVLFVHSPNNFIHVTCEFILGKLYTNVFLATLNGRRQIQFIGSTDTSRNTNIESHSMRVQTFSSPKSSRNLSREGPPRGVHISSKVYTGATSYIDEAKVMSL